MLFSGTHTRFHFIIIGVDKKMNVCVLVVSILRFHLYHIQNLLFLLLIFSPFSNAILTSIILNLQTHPTQSCFMSSIDVHTHYSYQVSS